MSAEHIAAAGAADTPKSVTRQPHPFYEGEFLETVRAVSNALPVPTATAPATASPIGSDKLVGQAEPNRSALQATADDQAKRIPHPFYEGEFLDPEEGKRTFADGGPGLADLIDMINPLQHIPVVSSIYRAITGDEISPAARLAGGALFGGPIGFAGAYVSGVVEDAADTSIGEIVVAAFTGDDNDVQTEQLAAITPAADGALVSAQRTTENVPETPSPIPPAIASSAAPEGPPKLIVDTTTAATLPLQAAFPQNQASPLSFARSLLESPTSAYATPSAASTKSVIAADEQSRQNEDLPDAVAAVLAARSQVPRGGNIPALGTSRMSPSTFEAVSTAALPDLPKTAPKTAGTDGAEPVFRRNTGAESVVPGKRGAPPPRNNSDISTSPRRSAAAASNVPNSMVPKAMMSALDKYETMIQQRRSADDDLTM